MLIEQNLTMKETSRIGIIGMVEARIKRAGSNRWKRLWKKPIKNKTVQAGLAHIVSLLGIDATKAFKYGAIGIGTTAATASDTALESQILTRVVAVFSTESNAFTGDSGKWISQFVSDTTSYAVTEYATFETASGPPMLNRVTFEAVPLNLNDIFELSYTDNLQEVLE